MRAVKLIALGVLAAACALWPLWVLAQDGAPPVAEPSASVLPLVGVDAPVALPPGLDETAGYGAAGLGVVQLALWVLRRVGLWKKVPPKARPIVAGVVLPAAVGVVTAVTAGVSVPVAVGAAVVSALGLPAHDVQRARARRKASAGKRSA